MVKKIVLLLILGLVFAGMLHSQEKGRRAPAFEVVSGDGQVMNLAGLKSYRVVVCFYETVEVIELNRTFKDELEVFYRKLSALEKGKIFFLSVGDCSSARWPFLGLWQTGLIDQSEKLGLTVYGDWTGEMREDFAFARNDSNFALIDANGVIIYQVSGKIGPEETLKIEGLILSLLK
jgi:hypothetical protein